MNSLDPRVNRLDTAHFSGTSAPKVPLDQFATFEVFVQPKEGKPFQHEGIVHAPNLEMAYVLAKEAFTRRFVCVSLYVVETGNVNVSSMLEGTANVYDTFENTAEQSGEKESYEIYHLTKRGKQHVHAGTIKGVNAKDVLSRAKETFIAVKGICNVWVVRTSDIRFTSVADKDLWNTLPDKKFRDATAYKGGDKLKAFLESRSH